VFFGGQGGGETDASVFCFLKNSHPGGGEFGAENSHPGGQVSGGDGRKYFLGGREIFETYIRTGDFRGEMPAEPHKCWL
jgi:hypothetical protein